MTNITKEQILAAYNWRAAIKEYDPNKRVSKEDMQFILETARLSPSSFGMEPWKFLVLERDVNPQLWQLLKENCWEAADKLSGASYIVVALSRRPIDLKPDSAYVEHMLRDIKKMPDEMVNTYRGFYKNYLENEAVVLNNDRYFEDWAAKQTYIALGNMLTTAAMIGVDSTPVEGLNYQTIDELLSNEGLFDIKHFKVSVMAIFGYRSKEPRPKTRLPENQVIEWIK